MGSYDSFVESFGDLIFSIVAFIRQGDKKLVFYVNKMLGSSYTVNIGFVYALFHRIWFQEPARPCTYTAKNLKTVTA